MITVATRHVLEPFKPALEWSPAAVYADESVAMDEARTLNVIDDTLFCMFDGFRSLQFGFVEQGKSYFAVEKAIGHVQDFGLNYYEMWHSVIGDDLLNAQIHRSRPDAKKYYRCLLDIARINVKTLGTSSPKILTEVFEALRDGFPADNYSALLNTLSRSSYGYTSKGLLNLMDIYRRPQIIYDDNLGMTALYDFRSARVIFKNSYRDEPLISEQIKSHLSVIDIMRRFCRER